MPPASHRRRRSCAVAHLVLLAALLGGLTQAAWPEDPPAPAPADAPTVGSALQPGVVVDASGRALFLMSPDGSVEAVEAKSGAVLWRTPAAGKPLALDAARLLTQADAPNAGARLDLLVLDVAKNGEVVARAGVDLPAGLTGGIDSTDEREFYVTATWRQRALYVQWEHHQKWAQRRPPPPDWTPRSEAGTVLVDLATGTATALGNAPLPVQAPDAVLEAIQTSEPGLEQLMRARNVVWAVPETREADPSGPAVHRWDVRTGRRLDPLRLEKDLRVSGTSSDGRHLAATRPAKDKGADASRRIEWHLFDPDLGKEVFVVVRDTPPAPFLVRDACLLQVEPSSAMPAGAEWTQQPLRVTGLDLTKGGTPWTRPLRDPRARRADNDRGR